VSAGCYLNLLDAGGFDEILHWGNVYVTGSYKLVNKGARLKGNCPRFEYQARPGARGVALFWHLHAKLSVNTCSERELSLGLGSSRERGQRRCVSGLSTLLVKRSVHAACDLCSERALYSRSHHFGASASRSHRAAPGGLTWGSRT
jgi:hypothetical protein